MALSEATMPGILGAEANVAQKIDRKAFPWLLTMAIGAATTLLYVLVIRQLSPVQAPFQLPWWGLAALFYIAEYYVVYLEFRGDAHSFGCGEIPLVIGLFFVDPTGLIVARMLGTVAVMVIHRRQSPLKVAFNSALFSLETCVALIVFHAIRSSSPIEDARWAAAFLAAFSTDLIGPTLINAVIYASTGSLPERAWGRSYATAFLVTGVATSVALVAVTLLWLDRDAAWLLIGPTTGLVLLYRAYSLERQKREAIDFLYKSSRILPQSLQLESAILTLLSQARKMFKAGVAEIVLLPEGPDGPAYATTLGPGEHIAVMAPFAPEAIETWDRVLTKGNVVLVAKPVRNKQLKRFLNGHGLSDAMVAPLQGEDGILGMLVVGNRLGEANTFDARDLVLFKTLANHASVVVRERPMAARTS